MKRRWGTVWRLAAFASFAILIALAGCATPQPAVPDNLPPLSAPVVRDVVHRDGRVFAVLASGRQFELDPIGYEAPLAGAMSGAPAGLSSVTVASLGQSAAALPDHYYGLIQYQTSIKDQGARATCVSFAVAAAMEARYKRIGLDLDLSEQYINHVAQMNVVSSTSTASAHETRLGTEGWYWNERMLAVLSAVTVPPAKDVPYIKSLDYENTNQAGDNPRIDTKDPSVSQATYDQFNLEEKPVGYSIPEHATFAPLPDQALQDARYGVRSYVVASSQQVSDPRWYEQTLVGGHEILIAVHLCPDPSPNNGIWNAGEESSKCGNHAMLIVGYDRTSSDPSQHFLITKNSLGGTDYVKLGYDFVDGSAYGKIFEAQYITDVIEPLQAGDFDPAALLGSWYVTPAGFSEPGQLDIYRVPQTLASNDYRIGTFYDSSRTAYRVNGTVGADGQVDFYIDSGQPNQGASGLSGLHNRAWLSATNPRLMSGYGEPGTASPSVFFGDKYDDWVLDVVPGTRHVRTGAGDTTALNVYVSLTRQGLAPTTGGVFNVSGPNASARSALGAGDVWGVVTSTAIDSVAGSYTVTATVGGRTLQRQFVLDDSDVLPVPANIQVTYQGGTELIATWDPVPGAVAYEVSVDGAHSVRSSSNSARVNGLTLQDGSAHELSVTAYTWDPAAPHTSPVSAPDPAMFSMSTASTSLGFVDYFPAHQGDFWAVSATDPHVSWQNLSSINTSTGSSWAYIESVQDQGSGWAFVDHLSWCNVDGVCDSRSFVTDPNRGLFVSGWQGQVPGYGWGTWGGTFDTPLELWSYPIEVGVQSHSSTYSWQTASSQSPSGASGSGTLHVTTQITAVGSVNTALGPFDNVFQFQFRLEGLSPPGEGNMPWPACFVELRAGGHGLIAARLCSDSQWTPVTQSFVGGVPRP